MRNIEFSSCGVKTLIATMVGVIANKDNELIGIQACGHNKVGGMDRRPSKNCNHTSFEIIFPAMQDYEELEKECN